MGSDAERLFIDQADIDNSPEQFNGFSSSANSYMPGDIKYTDINNDGVVNELDRVPIGNLLFQKLFMDLVFQHLIKVMIFQFLCRGWLEHLFYKS